MTGLCLRRSAQFDCHNYSGHNSHAAVKHFPGFSQAGEISARNALKNHAPRTNRSFIPDR